MNKYGKLMIWSIFFMVLGIIFLLEYYSNEDDKPRKGYEVVSIIITILSFCTGVIGFINMN